jgi:hypothetical protein
MNTYDRLLATWARQNAEAIYRHLETKVNSKVDWRQKGGPVEIAQFIVGSPSEWAEEPHEPYFEELQHVLNDFTSDFGIPLPAPLIAYKLSLWAGTKVPVGHPLVQNHAHWYDVAMKMEFDDAEPEDSVNLVKLLHTIAGEELAENLPTVDDIVAHNEAPTSSGKLFTVNAGDSLIYLTVGDDHLAAMNDEGQVVVLDFKGNRLHSGKDLSRIQDYITQGMKFSRP